MSRRNLAWLLGIVAVSVLAFSVFGRVPSRAENRDYELVRLVVDVLHEVREKYVVEVDSDRERKLVEDMINGGLERLDQHSTYINGEDWKQFDKTSTGRFGGIGIQVGYDRQNRGQLTVISPMVGTPAYKAGILAGDSIIKIDGKSTETMHLSDAIKLIQGEEGKEITLTVIHEGAKDPVDISMKRAIIKIESVLGDLRKADNPEQWDYFLDKKTYGVDRIGYIRLTNFSETATAEMKAAVTKLEQDGARGLIIDLRGNPGGLLQAAVDIADLFLTSGRIVSTKGRNEKEEIYDAKEEGTLMLPAEKYPIVILINKYSASASEILAAALQDHDRAVIVGERSYGKGSVQNIIKIPGDDGRLKLTTASYWRPSGKNIHRFPDSKETDEWGVKPNKDFEVPMKDEERLDYMIYRNDRDVIRSGKEKPAEPDKKSDKEDKKKSPFVDRVLEKAVDHLKKEIDKKGAALDVLDYQKT